jgi:DNA-binding Xre family transcriptional regulator
MPYNRKMSRTAARGQKLPPQEVEFLNSLSADALIVRVNALYTAGWSLQCIGEALSPKRPRTTIRSWVLKASSQEKSGTEVIDAPIPTPKQRSEEGGYQKKRNSPGIPNRTLEDIKQLAPLARTFRSRMASTSAPAVANQRLTELCKDLHSRNVSIRELAEAAGVTYRAMYKRVIL